MKKGFLYFLLTLFLFSCQKEKEVKSLKLAHSLSTDHPVHEAMVYFAERVEEKSNGELQIEIYSGGQLGSEQQCLELLQLGGLAMTKVSSAVMENFSPKLKVFGYPYIFRDKEHRYELYDSKLGRELLQGGEEYWLKGLTYFDAGSRSFYTRDTEIEKPSDLEGMKIRVMPSPTAIQLVKSLGSSPTPVSWGELYTSIQQGVVDGAENNLPSFYSSRHYEICKYYSVDEHSAIPDILVMSTQVYSSLNSEEKEWINESAEEAAIEQRRLWEEAEKEALTEIKKAGVKVNYPNQELFIEATRPVIENAERTNPELYKIIQQIKNIGK